MTREEWEASADLEAMLGVVRSRASERKLRLLTCALVRHAQWGGERQNVDSITAQVEDWLDGLTPHEEALAVAGRLATAGPEDETAAAFVTTLLLLFDAQLAVTVGFANLGGWVGPAAAGVLRCLFYNPCPPAPRRWGRVASLLSGVVGVFAGNPALLARDTEPEPLPVAIADPSWLTSDVVALVRGIYEERAFDRMPILADALMDAGCNDEDVLSHCRGPDEHVRGCWCLDMLLGKS